MAINTIKFSEMTPGGDLNSSDKTPGLLGGGNVLFNNPWTFLAPGPTSDRPTPGATVNGRLRFNTDTLIYEYYDTIPNMWVDLSGSGTGTVNPGTTNSLAFYAANGTAVSPTNSSPLSVLVTDGSGFPSLSNTLPTGLSIPSAAITLSTASLTSGQVAATPVNATDIANKAYVDSSFGAGVTSITGTTNQVFASSPNGAVTLSLPQDIATGSTPTFAGLTLTSIPLGGSSGGTGVNNGSKIITLGGSLTTSGAFASTFTMTGATNVTFPTTGTLATVGGTVSSITGTANQIAASASTGAVTLSLVSNPILPGTAGVTLPSGNTAARAGAAGTMRFNSQTTVFEATVDGSTWATIETSAIGVVSITGTANQVIASSPTGAVTLSLPQSIGTSNSPTFAGLTLTNPYIAGAGGLHSRQIFTSGTAATYTKPANVTSILVEVIGGGGAGGGATGGASTFSSGGGGGGGGYASLYIASAASTYTYTVGAGGTPGTAGNNPGNSGGTSTFSASSLQATGGTGGLGLTGIAATGAGGARGGSGGVGSNGNVNATGGPGGFSVVALAGINQPGVGGSAVYGGGGSTASPAGGNYGGGGAGANVSTVSAAGSAGAPGIIIVWEFS